MRHCLTLDLKNEPELIHEYKKWHSSRHIWKEIPEGIRNIGILEMEIFLWQNRLFMIVETENDFDWDNQMKKLATLPRQKEWEDTMDFFQQRLQNADNQNKWQKMERIFKLSDC